MSTVIVRRESYPEIGPNQSLALVESRGGKLLFALETWHRGRPRREANRRFFRVPTAAREAAKLAIEHNSFRLNELIETGEIESASFLGGAGIGWIHAERVR